MTNVRARTRKVIIACGGSAGHIFPGMTLAGRLTERYPGKVEVLFLTAENRLSTTLLEKSGFDFHTLPTRPLKRRTAPAIARFVSSLFRGSLRSARIIFSERPDCFVGFGSYIAGPPFVAASLLGIPRLIHEQNVDMGKANRLMRRFADKTAVSFDKGRFRKEAVLTGNPVRPAAIETRDKARSKAALGLAPDKSTILIIGGSQGSNSINDVVSGMLDGLENIRRERIQVLHICGEKDHNRLKEERRFAAITYKLYPFFDDMAMVYNASDIAISRAGSSAIFELCAHGIPSVLIPYPYAGGHQIRNAEFLMTKGAAIMIEETDLSPSSLESAVFRLLDNADLRSQVSEKMKSEAVKDAADRLADEVVLLMGLDDEK